MEATENNRKAPPAISAQEFFSRCEAMDLALGNLGRMIGVSGQTIRNWRKLDEDKLLPPWVTLAVIALEAQHKGEIDLSKLGKSSVSALARWQARRGFMTNVDTANAFTIRRQAVHNWYKRQRFPKWLPIACAGYDIWVESLNEGNHSLAA